MPAHGGDLERRPRGVEAGRLGRPRTAEDPRAREPEGVSRPHCAPGGGRVDERAAAARRPCPRAEDARGQGDDQGEARSTRPSTAVRRHEASGGGAPQHGGPDRALAQGAPSRPHAGGGSAARSKRDDPGAEAAEGGKPGPRVIPGARYGGKARDPRSLTDAPGRQRSFRDENQSPQATTAIAAHVRAVDAEACEEHMDLMSILEKAEARGQEESEAVREGEGLLEEEEDMLRRRAEQLERDMEALRAKKRRARLQKLEEGLREQAARDMKDFEDALQVHLEEQIRSLMRDKEDKAKACKQVVRELEENLEKLRLLIVDAKKKADAVDGAYSESVEQLRREHGNAISSKRSELHSKVADEVRRAQEADLA